MTPIRVLIEGAVGDQFLSGYRYFWLKYVESFDRSKHCAQCLKGPYSKRIRRDMALGQPVLLDEKDSYRYIYLCGVANPGYSQNLHLPMRQVEGARFEHITWNKHRITVENAELLPIPGLPPGYCTLAKSFTTCRNFQFGEAYLKTEDPPLGTLISE